MDFTSILYSKDQGVATITLNRPQTFNSLAGSLIQELVPAIEDCRDDPAVRVVVITGAGKAFCSGGDLVGARAWMEEGKNPTNYFIDLIKPLNRFIMDIRHLPKPVICSVNGMAAGAGFSLPLVCDLRIASDKAVFKLAYTRITGLVPDGGWTYFMPRIVGMAKATELMFLDRPMDAAEALRLGVVHRVAPHAELAQQPREMALELAGGPAEALARAKFLLNASEGDSLEAQLERERLELGKCAANADFREAVAAFFDKRPPKFGQ